MPRKMNARDPAAVAAFDAAFERIKVVTGFYTQVLLAGVLGVKQSSISDAKRRCSIPDSWLVTLLRTHQVLPGWILTGEGPQYLDNAHLTFGKVQERLQVLTEDFARLVCRVEDSLAFINMTDAERLQQRADKITELGADLAQIRDTHAELSTMATDVAAQATRAAH